MKNYIFLLPFLKKRFFLFILFIISTLFFSLFQGIGIGLLFPFLRVIFFNEPPPKANFILDKIFHFIGTYLVSGKLGIHTLLKMGIIVLILFFLKAFFEYLSKILNVLIQEGISKDIRDLIFSKMMNLPVSSFLNKKTGEIASRFTHDILYIKYALSDGWLLIIKDLMLVIAYLFIIFWASPHLSVFSLIFVPLVFLIIKIIGDSLKRKAKRFQVEMGKIGGFVVERIIGIKTIKAFTSEEKEIKEFKKITGEYFKKMLRFENLRHLSPSLTEFLVSLIAILVFLYGGKLIFIDRKLTPEKFIVFVIGAVSLLQPFKAIANAWGNIQQGLAGIIRVKEIVDEKEEERGGVHIIKKINKGIRFENVYFSYDGERYALKNINLEIKPYEKIALVGPSGAGKSTLINLVSGFYFPTKGKIFFDDKEIRELNIKELRKRIGIVPQEVFLFSGTLYENITYGKENAKEEEVLKAVEDAALSDFIKSLPHGLHTKIGEMGSKISGGEKQRIAIARAFLKNPIIIILDEATSQIDSETESKIQKALEKLEKDRITFIIAHRLNTVLNADRIVLLDKGEIKDIGKHDELIERSSLYKNLYELQFKNV
ncbi:MAG: ABC transporter ATP-binding protein [candidate division WOR-3 bacterium]